jgi:hypothetical protein
MWLYLFFHFLTNPTLSKSLKSLSPVRNFTLYFCSIVYLIASGIECCQAQEHKSLTNFKGWGDGKLFCFLILKKEDG